MNEFTAIRWFPRPGTNAVTLPVNVNKKTWTGSCLSGAETHLRDETLAHEPARQRSSSSLIAAAGCTEPPLHGSRPATARLAWRPGRVFTDGVRTAGARISRSWAPPLWWAPLRSWWWFPWSWWAPQWWWASQPPASSGPSPAWPQAPPRPATPTARASPSARPASGCSAPPWFAPPTPPAAWTPNSPPVLRADGPARQRPPWRGLRGCRTCAVPVRRGRRTAQPPSGGLVEDAAFEERRVRLEAGFRVVVYTDGP
jgi:hypothetical protein